MSYVFHKLAFKKLTPDKVVKTLNGKSFKKLTVAGLVTPPVHTHKYEAIWMTDAYAHWHECSCTDRTNLSAHTDLNGDGRCDVCNYLLPVTPPDHIPEYGSAWKYDAYSHWQECSCGVCRTNITAHADTDKDGKCDTCGYVMPVVPEPPKPEIPPIGIETDSFNLRLLGLEPGSYSIRATVSAMSLELRESDLSEPIKYVVK